LSSFANLKCVVFETQCIRALRRACYQQMSSFNYLDGIKGLLNVTMEPRLSDEATQGEWDRRCGPLLSVVW